MSDPLPAIAEDDATGETAALLADIRAVLGARSRVDWESTITASRIWASPYIVRMR